MLSGKKTVLLVDEGSQIHQTAMALSEESEYEVLLASSGSMGLFEARQSLANLDLLVTKVKLPAPGMSGIDLAAALSREKPQLKVLLMGQTEAEKLAAGERWPYLEQPFEEWQLRKMLRTLWR